MPGERVGFVGLGIMGRPMARNLVQAGHDVVVYNRTPEKAEELAKEGASAAGSLEELSGSCNVVFTMLPGPSEVEGVVAGDGGLLQKACDGLLVVDMSTSSPTLARDLDRAAQEKGASMLDAPVSGGDVGAREGTLSIMVGGAEEDFERARPLFEVMGETITHVGPSGAGQTAKACNQIVVALNLAALAEAWVLATRAGVDPERLLEALSGGLADTQVMQVKAEKILARDFMPGGKVSSHHKDLGIALETGREHAVPLPATALVEQMFASLMARGRQDDDHSALVTLVEAATQPKPG